jgi:hypothetical protein
MNKRHLHHLWRPLRAIKARYLLVIAVMCIVVAVVSLRQNNLTAVDLRDKVLQADKENKHVETALDELRVFVYAHMNTNLSTGTSVYPPIQLKYRYDRLVKAEKARVEAANKAIVRQAQAVCAKEPARDFAGRDNRALCRGFYVNKHNVNKHKVTVRTIPDSLYKFDFASPRWSPDRAGWSLVLAFVFAGVGVLRFTLGWFAKRFL